MSEHRQRMQKANARGRKILELVVAGKSNKAMAADLQVGIKTFEAHRAKIM